MTRKGRTKSTAENFEWTIGAEFINLTIQREIGVSLVREIVNSVMVHLLAHYGKEMGKS